MSLFLQILFLFEHLLRRIVSVGISEKKEEKLGICIDFFSRKFAKMITQRTQIFIELVFGNRHQCTNKFYRGHKLSSI